jgi:hypothetical protein
MTVNTLLAVQITVQAEYRARSFGAAADAPVEVMVTPAPAANVVSPTPIDCTSNCWPAEKTDGGIVTVTALAFEVVTSLSASPETNV